MGSYGVVPGGSASLADIITGMGKEKGEAASAQAQPALIQSQTQHNLALADQERQRAELMRRQAADAAALQRAYASVDPSADAKTMMQQVRSAAIRNGMTAGGIMSLDTHHADLMAKNAQIAEHERATSAANHGEVGDILMGIKALPEEQRAAAWQSAAPRLSQLEPKAGFTPQYPGSDAFGALIGGHALAGKIQGFEKGAADIRNTTAQAAGREQETQFDAQLQPLKQAEEQAKRDAEAREQYARDNPNDEAAQRAAMTAKDAATVAQQARAAKETQRHNSALESIQRARMSMEGSQTFMVPNPDGTYQSVRVRPGESVPPGAVSAAGMTSLTVPTAATRSMAEAAPKVTSFVDRIEQLINAQDKKLGPASGRMREFLAGKLGANDPEYIKLRTDIGLLQTALMRMHVGARGGSQMMEHFKDLIDSSKQDPDNLRAALGEIRDYAKTVAGDHGGGAANKGPAVGVVEDGYRFKGGDPSKPENWEKVR